VKNRKTIDGGFTLIELLVVITIIVILAAILFPVFALARERANQTACLSNVKQIAAAWMMYVQDYDDTFAPRNAPKNANGTPSTTYALQPQPAPGAFPCKPCRPMSLITGKPYDQQLFIMPYIQSLNVFHCPSDTGIKNVPAEPTLGKPVWQVEGSSYCLNTVVTRVGTLGAIPYPSETYMGAEDYSWHFQADNATFLWSSHSGTPTRNTYFVDGHAAAVPEAYIALQCSPNPSMFEDTAAGTHIMTIVP
jgi:prepilin-type N-terminal cleavage/methylation domain-containing protein/prepilin-type processing-associated H-X9-DG protein